MMPGFRILALAPAWILVVFGTVSAQSTEPPRSVLSDAPSGFVPPPLHPQDTHLRTVDLGHGAYALVSSLSGPDNSGFVVGENGVLVIDTHINPALAGAIQEAVRAVTDKPIRFVVNTNYHGDHTFGNHAFPSSTVIIAHRDAADRMRWFDEEKADMIALVGGDESLFEFGAATYLRTLRSLVNTRGPVAVVVPGHLALSDGRLFYALIAYSEQLLATVREAIADSVPENTLVDRAELPAGVLPEGAPAALVAFLTGVHRLDLLRTYREEQATPAVRGPTAR